MILRVMRGRGTREEVMALRAALDEAFVPGGAERRGLERLHIGWRESHGPSGDDTRANGEYEVAVVSHWISAEAAASSDAAEASGPAYVRSMVRDVEVVHFEVDETIRRQSNDSAVAIRIATGRFTQPGADTEMQNLLRQRAPLIGDEMAEAWVGRRLSGRAVEVTFVSAWRGLPEHRSLEDAFWPDIALRYEQFVVEVYTPVAVE